ncbi:MAG: FKBP-type peptidyl-prolyl cis-trans isomerase [Bacteroidaceae bacterium]|nr:FKBP-type peptidyl-prolyl cis-trans isomerase [Bacteroidaceae bacterium]
MKHLRIFLMPVMMSLFASLLSCGSGVSDKKVKLENANDSISFAVSMLISQDMPVAMAELGIDESTLDAFIKGLCDAFPVDETPEAQAYAHGVVMAASAMDMLDRANEAIYPNDTINKVNRKMFLEGLKASAYGSGRTMTTKNAIDYYNQRVFRSVSEEFIRKNKERKGVKLLPGGVQYKIETLGSGEKAKYTDVVKCIYKGTYPNGVVFDTSRGAVVELEINTLVPGLSQALTHLPVGTVCKVYIPWEQGYGAKGTNSIAPYSALVYDIEIIGIVNR